MLLVIQLVYKYHRGLCMINMAVILAIINYFLGIKLIIVTASVVSNIILVVMSCWLLSKWCNEWCSEWCNEWCNEWCSELVSRFI